MVALLGPRIRKEEMNPVERRLGQHLLEHEDRVVVDDPDVCKPARLDSRQKLPHARLVDLDAEEVHLGHRRGELGRRCAHPETDLEDDRPIGGRKKRARIYRRLGAGNAVPVAEPVVGVSLVPAHPGRATRVALDMIAVAVLTHMPPREGAPTTRRSPSAGPRPSAARAASPRTGGPLRYGSRRSSFGCAAGAPGRR